MIIFKDDLIRKIKRKPKTIYCCICRKNMCAEDFFSYNFEYIKNKRGEKFSHKSCIKGEMKQ